MHTERIEYNERMEADFGEWRVAMAIAQRIESVRSGPAMDLRLYLATKFTGDDRNR